MLAALNIFLMLFLLAMLFVWATYGFFSALLHLVIVIIAGVMAFSMWEPVSYMLLGRMPAYAHGVGLLAPFAILLIVLRAVFDKLCRMNVKVHSLLNQIGGAICGAAAGSLAMGVFLIGTFFLPIDLRGMGYEPTKLTATVNGQTISRERGGIWKSHEVHVWAGAFFGMLSDGAMKPIGGPSLNQARPDLASRAIAYSNLDDANIMRSAHPESVEIVGLYAVPATEDGIRALAERTALFAFLNPGYEMPEEAKFGDNGMGLVNAVLRDLRNRHRDAEKYGRPSAMLNLEVILEVARTPKFRFDNPTSEENFEQFINVVATQVADDLIEAFKGNIGEGNNLWLIDTRWKNEKPGTYNTDGNLRIPMRQVSLQVSQNDKLRLVGPSGYSIQYNQNTGARTFLPAASGGVAFSPYEDFHLGWVFLLPDKAEPKYFFCRELRFDLEDMPTPEDQDTPVNQNFGATAYAMGLNALPKAAEGGGPNDPNTGGDQTLLQGVQIAATGAYADLSEALPISFAAAATNFELDEETTPWTIKAGKSESVARGRGGKKNTVREVFVPSGKRLVRVKLDDSKAKSLYGRARELAAALGVMQVSSEGGNDYSAIGFAKLKTDGTMHIEFRSDAIKARGLSAAMMPDMNKDEQVYIYFEVPVSAKKIVAYKLGNDKQEFETPLEIKAK